MKFLLLLARVFFSILFIKAGLGHFSEQSAQYAGAQGVPMPHLLVPLSGVLAIAGGVSILLGLKAKVGAWLLILFLVPVTLMMHQFWTITDPQMAQMQQVNFLKNLCLIGGCLYIACFGAGAWSIDALMAKGVHHRHRYAYRRTETAH